MSDHVVVEKLVTDVFEVSTFGSSVIKESRLVGSESPFSKRAVLTKQAAYELLNYLRGYRHALIFHAPAPEANNRAADLGVFVDWLEDLLNVVRSADRDDQILSIRVESD